MGHHEHRHGAPQSVNIAILSVSSTRSRSEDESGQWMAAYAARSGHQVVAHEVVGDRIDDIRSCLNRILTEQRPHAVIVTGGTGITPSDVTIEAVQPLLVKEMTAFGTLFTQLSYDEIGSAAMLSRACAGVSDRAVIFCIPGSLNACKMACKRLIIPEIGHLVRHASGV